VSTEPEWFDPMDISIAIAMRNTGFSEEDIISVLGYMPNLNITFEQIEASVAAELALQAGDE
jgi:hypothetical protein